MSKRKLGDMKHPSKIDTIAEEEKSDIEDRDESPPIKQKYPTHSTNKKQRRKSNLDLATVEDK